MSAGPQPLDGRTTVVVITHNRRTELLRTLGKLDRLPERPEVIVTDNASTDGTSEAVRTDFPRVRLLSPGRNLGAVARNLAARGVRTPYVAFCDDDSWWEPGSLRRAGDILAELRQSPLAGPGWLPGPALGSFLAAATVLHADAFRGAGGFHPGLWLGGEEELLATDLLRQGWWLTYAEDLLVHHQASVLRDSTRRRILGLRNTLWFTWLCRPLLPALRRTAQLLVGVPRDLSSARATAEALAGLPWILRQRAPVGPELERMPAALERARRHSDARKHVG